MRQIDNTNKTITLAFVGVGFSAHSIIYNLNRYINTGSNIRILLFDRRSLFGYGVPYNTDIDHVLLNRPSKLMSLDYESTNDFYEFLLNDKNKYNYHTRKQFGYYLKARWQTLLTSLTCKGVSFDFIADNVSKIIKNIDGFSILTDNSGQYCSDVTILSSGNNRQNNIFNLSGSHYVNNLYENFQVLKYIKSNHRVLIIGTGLSAIDCINFLTKNGNFKGNIYCFSRTGMIPSTRNISNSNLKLVEIPKLLNKKDIKISHIIRALDKECKKINPNCSWKEFITNSNYFNTNAIKRDLEIKENTIQSILVSTNQAVEKIWEKMTINTKKTFMKKYYRRYMMQRNPMPKQSALMLLNLIEKGQVKYLADEIDSIDFKDETYLVKTKNNALRFDYILNATGQDLNASNYDLYNDLLSEGLITKNILGGINVCLETQRTINNKGDVNENLYCIGAKTIGTYINVNSAEMISYRAKDIARLIVKNMKLVKLQENSVVV